MPPPRRRYNGIPLLAFHASNWCGLVAAWTRGFKIGSRCIETGQAIEQLSTPPAVLRHRQRSSVPLTGKTSHFQHCLLTSHARAQVFGSGRVFLRPPAGSLLDPFGSPEFFEAVQSQYSR